MDKSRVIDGGSGLRKEFVSTPLRDFKTEGTKHPHKRAEAERPGRADGSSGRKPGGGGNANRQEKVTKKRKPGNEVTKKPQELISQKSLDTGANAVTSGSTTGESRRKQLPHLGGTRGGSLL